MARVTLDQVFDLIDQLSAADKARLISRVAPEIVQVLERDGSRTGETGKAPGETATGMQPDIRADAWAELAHIGAELSAMGPSLISTTEALSAMRR
jgi:hypothetical protein